MTNILDFKLKSKPRIADVLNNISTAYENIPDSLNLEVDNIILIIRGADGEVYHAIMQTSEILKDLGALELIKDELKDYYFNGDS